MFCHLIIGTCCNYVSNLIIMKNGWTTDSNFKGFTVLLLLHCYLPKTNNNTLDTFCELINSKLKATKPVDMNSLCEQNVMATKKVPQ